MTAYLRLFRQHDTCETQNVDAIKGSSILDYLQIQVRRFAFRHDMVSRSSNYEVPLCAEAFL